jgi:hypothetical protein
MPQSRAIVGHSVSRSREIVVTRHVAVKPLVKGLETKEICSRSHRRCGPFALPEDGRCVVVKQTDGVFTHIHVVNEDVLVCDGARELQITVSNGTLRVVVRHQGLLNRRVELRAPEEGLVVTSRGGRDKVHTSHTAPCGVSGAQGTGVLLNHLVDSRRPVG